MIFLQTLAMLIWTIYFFLIRLAFSCQRKKSNWILVFVLVKECENWRITVIPLLTQQFDQLNALRALITVLIEDCQWFSGHIDVRFLTNQHEFLHLKNFEEAAHFVFKPNEFIYTPNETEFAYILAVENAIADMPKAEAGNGRYIFIVTDFERSQSELFSENIMKTPFLAAGNDRELRLIDRQLRRKTIQMVSLKDSSNKSEF